MDLSIIIVNWNSKEYLEKCIASILASTHGISYEIVVIDGGSFDGSGEMLRKRYRQVRFIQNEKNLGFARTNNIASQVSNGRNVLFLNPDTEIEGPAIERLSHYLDVLPNAGIVGAKLLNSDGSVQTSCIQAFPTILNQFLDSNACRAVSPGSGMWGMRPLFTGEKTPAEVDAVSGACLMIKRSLFERIGMFSSDYFMYSEDIDLCFKVREAGRKTYYVPTAVVVHHGGVSSSRTGESAFSSVMLLESRWRFFRKTRPPWYCASYRMAMLFASMIRIGLAMLAWPIYGLRGKAFAMGNVMKKWIAKLRWTLGGEGWVRNY